MIIKGLKFVQTCFACPEQYDVFDSKQTKVGYVRLRWGNLTVECPDCGGELVYEHYFENDSFKGCFDSTEERQKYLELIADCILISKRS
jgi:ribosomal protein S27E